MRTNTVDTYLRGWLLMKMKYICTALVNSFCNLAWFSLSKLFVFSTVLYSCSISLSSCTPPHSENIPFSWWFYIGRSLNSHIHLISIFLDLYFSFVCQGVKSGIGNCGKLVAHSWEKGKLKCCLKCCHKQHTDKLFNSVL